MPRTRAEAVAGCYEEQPGVWKKIDQVHERQYRFYECQDCRVPYPPIFMVRHRLWMSLGFPKHGGGMLCWYCCEARLGRKLTEEDLIPGMLCNEWWRMVLRGGVRGEPTDPHWEVMGWREDD